MLEKLKLRQENSTFNIPNLTDRFLEGNGYGYIEAGLPDITGYFDAAVWNGYESGIFKKTNSELHSRGSSGANLTFFTYDVRASYSNSIYGQSSTVQPATCKCYFVIKY